MKFPPLSLDDLIVLSPYEKLTDHIKSWHLHSQIMSQNFKKIGSAVLELLPFFSFNDPILIKTLLDSLADFFLLGHIFGNFGSTEL